MHQLIKLHGQRTAKLCVTYPISQDSRLKSPGLKRRNN